MIEVKNPTDSRFRYIGVRSCQIKPEEDVYFGSCKPFKQWQATHGTTNMVKTVLATWPTREEALSHEILLHDCFDVARNPEFWNQAKHVSTGFDTTGVPKTEEHKKKIGRSGKDHWTYNKTIPLETRIKMSESHKGEKSYWFGKKLSEETKRKISEAQKGEKSWCYGKKFPEKGIAVSKALKGKPKQKTTCPHCGLFGAVNNLKYYHFDNCKVKK